MSFPNSAGEETPESLRYKLERLSGEERLSVEAVKGAAQVVNERINAIVAHRTGTLASLLALAGVNGEISFPTDSPGLVKHNGVAGGAVLVSGSGSGQVIQEATVSGSSGTVTLNKDTDILIVRDDLTDPPTTPNLVFPTYDFSGAETDPDWALIGKKVTVIYAGLDAINGQLTFDADRVMYKGATVSAVMTNNTWLGGTTLNYVQPYIATDFILDPLDQVGDGAGGFEISTLPVIFDRISDVGRSGQYKDILNTPDTYIAAAVTAYGNISAGQIGSVFKVTNASAGNMALQADSVYSANAAVWKANGVYETTIVQYGAGAVTVTAGSGVTLRVGTGKSAATTGQYTSVTVRRIGANEWMVV